MTTTNNEHDDLKLNIKAAKERLSATTPGPWTDNGHATVKTVVDGQTVEVAECYTGEDGMDAIVDDIPFNAIFIAHARTDLPAALAWIEEAREVVWLSLLDKEYCKKRTPEDSVDCGVCLPCRARKLLERIE